MQTYTSYKTSNIEWIGEIPSHWKVTKVKYIADIFGRIGYRGYTVDDIVEAGQGSIAISPANIQNDIFKIDNSTFISWDKYYESPEIMIFENDIILVKTGSTIGKTAIIPKDCPEMTINPQLVVLKNVKIDHKFFYYQTLCDYFKLSFEIEQTGSTTPTISQEKINSFPVLNLSYLEQQAIVNYLDHKTALIDELIIKKEKKIELLKEQRSALINHVVTKGLNPNAPMKDSGIDWIGEIPEHWERKKIKQISKIISKGTTPSTVGRELLDEGEVRYLKAENISDNKVMLFPSFFIDNETDKILSRSKLLENDILLVIAGATLGKVAILTKEFIPANTNQAVSFIRLKENHNVKYIWYWLSSSILQQQIWIDAVQSAQPNLSMENLGNFCFTFPPLFEQKDIVKFLDNQTTIIDKSIEIETQKIEKLKEYRQSLISNVVTGKIKVF
ncbi:restriction endonuclease subunit S [Emticicia sp. TH156]|uniref:restriction endonuclease subunit S n=1 Tax=Emticicia sp. TH156 TaxID=2067454 RepID=UPI000C78CAFE|nr:restriction endonuclease subunit S [Emticicia sp. TH156]PLK44812.1 hypothetical protein C0V77_10255 [Emticicia sp. TH156]